MIITLQNDADLGILSYSPYRVNSTSMGIGERADATQYHEKALIKFSELSTNILFKNRNILSAKLILYLHGSVASAESNVNMYPVLRDWSEATASWSVWQTGSNWTTAGCGGAGTDFENTVVGTLPIPIAEYGFYEWPIDVNNVIEMINGIRPNYGWILVSDALNSQHSYRTSEYTTIPERCPALELTFGSASGIMGIL